MEEFFLFVRRCLVSFIITKASNFWLELELSLRNSTGGLGMAGAQVLLVVGCWLLVGCCCDTQMVFQI